MRDRMRGNLYPFVPLSDEQTRIAFDLQLQARPRGARAGQARCAGRWPPSLQLGYMEYPPAR